MLNKHVRPLFMLLLLCMLLPACKQRTGGGSGSDNPVVATVPDSIDFRKVSVGLPSDTLDFIGMDGFSLAGAKKKGLVFFAVSGKENIEVYERNLESGERRQVTTMETMVPGTLATDPEGRVLAYCRGRELATYFDDPSITSPDQVGVVYRFDVASGTETAVYDFKKPEWLPYRSATHVPQISPDGKRIVVLTFDFDLSMLGGQLDYWLAYEEEFTKKWPTLVSEDVKERTDSLRALLNEPHVKSRLEAQGITVAETGKPTDAEREGVRKLVAGLGPPSWALLIARDGESEIVKLKPPAEFDRLVYSLVAVGDSVVVVAATDPDRNGRPETLLFTADTASGEMKQFGSFSGSPSSMALDPGEDALIVLCNMIVEGKVAAATSHLTIPLAGGEITTIDLESDLMGQLDVTTDGRTVVGQDRVDQNVYAFNAADGTRKLLLELAGNIGGVFLADDGRRAAYLENGLTFGLEVPEDPQADPGWVSAEHFAVPAAAVRAFLTQMGYTVPADLTTEWEEHDGLGVHEFHSVASIPAKAGMPVLMRYSADDKRVTSMWFPSGNPFLPAAKPAALDAYDAEKIARDSVLRAGWMSDKLQKYQPGANPLYDGPSDTWVFIFREGYTLEGEGGKWVANAEATTRVRKSTGEVVEMNIEALPQVQGQALKIDMKAAEYSIRNWKAGFALPEEAPLRLETEAYRLVVARDSEKLWGPAQYTMPGEPRLCYEIDGFIQPEDELVMTTRVDTETGEVLGQMYFLPTSQAGAAR